MTQLIDTFLCETFRVWLKGARVCNKKNRPPPPLPPPLLLPPPPPPTPKGTERISGLDCHFRSQSPEKPSARLPTHFSWKGSKQIEPQIPMQSRNPRNLQPWTLTNLWPKIWIPPSFLIIYLDARGYTPWNPASCWIPSRNPWQLSLKIGWNP